MYAIEEFSLSLKQNVEDVLKIDCYKNCPKFTVSTFGDISMFVGYSGNIEEHILNEFLLRSQTWCIPLNDYVLENGRLHLKVSREHVFQNVICHILKLDHRYGHHGYINKKAFLKNKALTPSKNLTEHRQFLLEGVARNAMTCNGYEIVDNSEQADCSFQITSESVPDEGSLIALQCGFVTGSDNHSSPFTVEQYKRLLENDIRQMSHHKYWQTEKDDVIEKLTNAVLAVNLLKIKHSTPVKLKINDGGHSSRDAVFILYNVARISAIKHKYEEGILLGSYPKLPEPEQLDFKFFQHSEEWKIVYNFLLQYPLMMEEVLQRLHQGEILIHHIVSFVQQLCHAFSKFYRRVRVLQEPKPHLLPTIFARILFTLATGKVLHNALNILNIEPVQSM